MLEVKNRGDLGDVQGLLTSIADHDGWVCHLKHAKQTVRWTTLSLANNPSDLDLAP